MSRDRHGILARRIARQVLVGGLSVSLLVLTTTPTWAVHPQPAAPALPEDFALWLDDQADHKLRSDFFAPHDLALSVKLSPWAPLPFAHQGVSGDAPRVRLDARGSLSAERTPPAS